MDDDDLVNFLTKPNFEFAPPVRIERPASSGRLISPTPHENVQYEKRDVENTTKYAERYISKEKDQLFERFIRHDSEFENSKGINEAFYHKYHKCMGGESTKRNRELPIFQQEHEILQAIQHHPVVILEGPTGCGKTTQVPQFIFDEAIRHRKNCNIVICQPRRVAAESNAARVAVERNWPLSTVVGYQVGLDQRTNQSDDTRILFCTTGVMLEKLIRSAKKDNPLAEYTHVILDEVHERDKNMDFLFIVLKKLINPRVKIILMSATINARDFSEYFSMPINGRFKPAPVISINRKNKYTVETYYLDDLEYLNRKLNPNFQRNYVFNFNAPTIHDEVYNWALRLIIIFERMDRQENEESDYQNENYDKSPKPSVLIFLPGINEINTMYRYLEEWKILNRETDLVRIIMHSSVTSKQTAYALQPTEENQRKIILATNVAESSITVPDVKYVIDFCLTKNMINDSKTNFTTLRLDWASHTNCEQRKGRTGRQMNGKCYRLVPYIFYQNEMKRATLPEMIRSPLEHMVLKTKLLEMGKPVEILALAMDKPNLADISNSILQLKEAGGLFRTVNGILSDMDGDISFIGRVMADLPLDIKLTKLLILGYCFSALSESIIMAAALNCTHAIFKPRANGVNNFYTQLLRWSNGSGSDLFATLHVYNVWRQKHQRGEFGTCTTKNELLNMRKKENAWADTFGLNVQGLKECLSYVEDIKNRLWRKGIKTNANGVKWTHNDKVIILKVVIAGAFYPNYFIRTPIDEREAFNTINGLDPRNTVYFSNFRKRFDRCFYVKKIKEYFVREKIVAADDLVNIKVTFGDSEKAFVTFKNSDEMQEDTYGLTAMPGKILPEIFKSVKARQSNARLNLKVMEDPQCIERIAEARGLIPNVDGTYTLKSYIRNKNDICIPRMLDETVVGAITHVDHCGRFWLQPIYRKTDARDQRTDIKTRLAEFDNELNCHENNIEPFHEPQDIKVGQILAAPFASDDSIEYFRAKVLKIIHNPNGKPESYKVFFVDFGNTHICLFTELRRMRGVAAGFIDIPPCCFECCLTEVQPAVLDSQNGSWSKEAIEWFSNATDGKKVTAHVYSVVNGISSVVIEIGNVSINKKLIEKGFADYCEENYASKTNNAARMNAQSLHRSPNEMDAELIDYLEKDFQPEIDPPPDKLCDGTISLKGPKSSLETTISAMIQGGRGAGATIDSDSVNCVLLNNDPQEHTNKYMVAASVTQKANNIELVARHTTLMPNIRGFGPLMALIFCPTMEIKRDKHKNRYMSIITGMGFNENTRAPYFEEHDMKMDLDVEITNDDIDKINEIRMAMDTLLFTQRGHKLANVFTGSEKIKLTKKIKNLIVALLEKTRKSVEQGAGIVWNEYPTADILEPHLRDTFGNRAIFPLHRTLKLQPMSIELKQQLRENCQQLHRFKNLTTTSIFNRGEYCNLCEVHLASATEVRYHLITRLHTDRESDIGFQYNK